MAFNILCTAFRRIAINQRGKAPVRSYFKGQVSLDKDNNGLNSLTLQTNGSAYTTNINFSIKFAPRTLNVEFELPKNNGVYQNIIEIPFRRIPIIENPNKYLPIQHDLPLLEKSMELPTNINITEKQAASMIIIRRKKMKKHQRKKFRKRMQFFWRKVKQRRELLREKNFQAEQVALIQKAENFDPAKYVMEKLHELEKEFIPRTYRSEVLPQDMIKKFIEEKKRKLEAKYNKRKLTL